MEKTINQIVQYVDTNIDVHCHNDFGLALANAMTAIRAGADCIHVSINGLGERTGIPDLVEVVMAYHILENESKYSVDLLTEISSLVQSITNHYVAANKPITGSNAFTHNSGVHADGFYKDKANYRNFSPDIIGREDVVVIDKFSGKSTINSVLDELGIKEQSSKYIDSIVQDVKLLSDNEHRSLSNQDVFGIANRYITLPENLSQ